MREWEMRSQFGICCLQEAGRQLGVGEVRGGCWQKDECRRITEFFTGHRGLRDQHLRRGLLPGLWACRKGPRVVDGGQLI